MPVINRFWELLQAKESEERQNISIAEVARKTGIPRKTIQAWAHGRITRFDASVIEALCKYFNCSVCQLIEYKPKD